MRKKKKANLKNAPRVGCNDIQETNMHSFIKQFLQAEDERITQRFCPQGPHHLAREQDLNGLL